MRMSFELRLNAESQVLFLYMYSNYNNKYFSFKYNSIKQKVTHKTVKFPPILFRSRGKTTMILG